MQKLDKTVTLPPPKSKPWFTCSADDCQNEWQAYHGKVGCLCHDCDCKTPQEVKRE